MSEHEFIRDLKEKCDQLDISFTAIYTHIEKLVKLENIKFFYVTSETRADEKKLELDIFIITLNSVCIGYSLYKDGRSRSAKFLVKNIISIEISSVKNTVQIQITRGDLMGTGWSIVDIKNNEDALNEFHLNLLSVWELE